jgi:hypothetical protein
MKKIFIIWLVALFVVPTALLAAEHELEKISSPDQIKYFKVMKKEGGALFGVRLNKTTDATDGTAIANSASSATLEKIAGPWELPLFQKIKKVGNALWGYRKDEGRHLGWVKNLEISPEMRVCLKNAVNAKDQALKTSVEKAKTLHLTMIDKRNACQIAALDATSSLAVIRGFQTCSETFKQDARTAEKTIRDERNSLHNNYKESLRACYKLSAVADTVANPVSTGNVMLENAEDELAL